MKKLFVIIIGIVILTGCTTPKYARTVERSYDASGVLTGTVVKEYIEQSGAIDIPMRKVLKDQTYKR